MGTILVVIMYRIPCEQEVLILFSALDIRVSIGSVFQTEHIQGIVKPVSERAGNETFNYRAPQARVDSRYCKARERLI